VNYHEYLAVSELRRAVLKLMGATIAAGAQSMTNEELGECLLTGRWTTIEVHEAGRRLKQAATNDGEDEPATIGKVS